MIKILKRIFNKVKYNFLPLFPEYHSKYLFKKVFKQKLDLSNPITYNEKIMWLKLYKYNKNKLVTQCADKFRVREYIKACGCEEILNDLINVWDRVEDIDWESLPHRFIIKCNHGSGYNIVCFDKLTFDIEEAKRKLKRWMKEDYWKLMSEHNYKEIKKKIICEKFLENEAFTFPQDYKLLCCNGKAEYLFLWLNRKSSDVTRYTLDRHWKSYPFLKINEKATIPLFKDQPKGFDQLFYYAEILSKPFPFVRVDFYLVEGRVIFGELTFTPSAGLDSGLTEEADRFLGDRINLNYQVT